MKELMLEELAVGASSAIGGAAWRVGAPESCCHDEAPLQLVGQALPLREPWNFKGTVPPVTGCHTILAEHGRLLSRRRRLCQPAISGSEDRGYETYCNLL